MRRSDRQRSGSRAQDGRHRSSRGGARSARTARDDFDEEVTAPIPAALAQRWELLDDIAGRRDLVAARVGDVTREFRATLLELQRMEEERGELRHELEQVGKELVAIRRDAARSRRDAIAVQHQLEAARRETGAARVESRHSRSHLADARLAFTDERKRLLELEGQLRQRQASLDRALARERVRVGQQGELQCRLEAVLEDRELHDAQLQELCLELEEATLEAQSVRQQLDEVTQDRNEFRTRARRASAGVRAARAVAQSAVEQTERLEAALELASTRLADLEAGRLAVEQRLLEREQVLDAAQVRSSQLEALVAEQGGALDAMSSRVAELESQALVRERDLEAASTRLGAAEAAEDSAVRDAAVVQLALESAQERIQGLEADSSQARARSAANDEALEAAQAHVSELQAAATRAETEAEQRLAEQREQAEAALAEQREQAEAVQAKQREQADVALEELRARSESALDEQIATVERAAADHQQALRQATEQVGELQAQVERLSNALEAERTRTEELSLDHDEAPAGLEEALAEASMARSLVDAQGRELERVRSRAEALSRELDELRAGAGDGEQRRREQIRQLELARKAVYRYRRRSQHDRARWKAQEADLGTAITGLYAVAHAFPRQLDEMEAVMRKLRVILEGTRKTTRLHRAEAERAYRALFPVEPKPPRVSKDEQSGS